MRRFIIVLLALLVVVGIIIALRPQLAYPFLPNGHPVRISEMRDALSIRLEYPEFGRPTIDADARIHVEDLMQAALVENEHHEHTPGITESLTVTYRIAYRTPRYASVVLDVQYSSQTRTVAYPIARTYDVRDDRVLGPADLSEGPEGMAKLNAIVREFLEGTDGIDPQLMDRGLRPTPTSFQNFILTRDEVHFYLTPGQVALPAAGTFIVRVPRERLMQ